MRAVAERGTRRRGWRDEDELDLLVDRGAELDLLSRSVTGLSLGRSALVVIENRPGAGRTALVRRTIALAEAAGIRVCPARGSRTESELRYGLVSQLLSAFPADDCPVWTDARWAESERESEVLPALCREFLGLARREPLLVVVDDAHWADPWSARWLRALARRLREVPLLLVVAGNDGCRPIGLPAIAELAAPRSGSVAAHLLRPGPLSPAGVNMLLATACPGPLDEDFSRALLRATSGQVWLVRAVLRQFARTGLAPVMEHLGELHGTVATELGDRVARLTAVLPEELVGLLRALAVCGSRLDFRLVCSLAGLRTMPESEALARLEGVGLVRPGDEPELSDPVTASRVLSGMPERERAELHAAAAELGHRSAIPDRDVAGMLLAASPIGRPWAAELLSRAAARDRNGKRPAEASRFLQRALKEPLSEPARARLMIELATAELGPRHTAGTRLLGEVISGPGGAEVAEYRLAAADLLLAGGEVEVVRRHLVGALRRDTRPYDRALTALYWLSDIAGSVEDEPFAPGRLAPAGAENVRATSDSAQAGVLAWREAMNGRDLERVRASARAALRPAAGGGALICPRMAAARALGLTHDWAEGLAGLDQVLIEARRVGVDMVLAAVLLLRAGLCLGMGRIKDAERDLAETLRQLPLREWRPLAAPSVVSVQAVLHLEHGDPEAAGRVLAEFASALPPGATEGMSWCHFLFARARFQLSVGEPTAAVADLLECGRRLLHHRVGNPAVIPWRSTAALALHAVGEQEEAERLLAEERAHARTWGEPKLLGSTLLASAHVLAESAPEEAAALVAEASGQLGTTVDDLPGGRPVLSALSELERRVAELVARGRSTSEIAVELAVSRRGVELNLNRVYHKLGLSGRGELVAAFGHRGRGE
ncbi:tetratricopeptide repeat protein [Allokutzneria sp. A3M-2-11 16]|uniref:tetratricopeptide repeat protein n=1 Tax=Allokutzneria sp. A3M-2-11 16 TaxID=2962043 RepID=UPI0020B7BBE8|nr:helix-turn-helix transcriptional regulator [Allokutzneria sp. A3M-2-11 16]MCP3803269.1 tetratricopeptide repeat protein [Allokutzneria sp. A3M-2-11 16]